MEGRVEVCHNQIWWAVSAWLLLLAGTAWDWDFRDAMHCCVQAFTLLSKLRV